MTASRASLTPAPSPTARTRAPRSAIAWLLTGVLLATMVGISIASGGAPDTPAYVPPLYTVIVGCYGAVGAVLVTRLPRNPIGWILWVTGGAIGLSLAAGDWAALSVRAAGGELPGTVAAAWFTTWSFSPTMVLALLFLPLLFPDGALPSRRWRGVAVVFAALVVVVGLPDLLRPGRLLDHLAADNPTGIPGSEDVLAVIGAVTSLCAPIALPVAMAAAVIRYRRGSLVERQQLRWFGTAIAVGLFGILTISLAPAPIATAGWVVASIGLGAIPIAIGIAVMRYRLYEIDRIISRTIAWLVLTALLAALFAALIVGLQALLAPVTESSTLAVAASTLATFAVFQPLRRRVQMLVDRRFNRARVGTQRAMDAFGAHLRDGVDLAMLQDRLTGTVDGAMRPSQIALWIRGEGAK